MKKERWKFHNSLVHSVGLARGITRNEAKLPTFSLSSRSCPLAKIQITTIFEYFPPRIFSSFFFYFWRRSLFRFVLFLWFRLYRFKEISRFFLSFSTFLNFFLIRLKIVLFIWFDLTYCFLVISFFFFFLMFVFQIRGKEKSFSLN